MEEGVKMVVINDWERWDHGESMAMFYRHQTRMTRLEVAFDMIWTC